jgi:hypothetical protein
MLHLRKLLFIFIFFTRKLLFLRFFFFPLNNAQQEKIELWENIIYGLGLSNYKRGKEFLTYGNF